MSYLGYDEWAPRPRRPTAHHQHSAGYYLDPNAPFRRDSHGGLNRTRSQGHSPMPVVNVYNDVHQDANQRADSHSLPYPPAPMPVYPPSPNMRGRNLGDELIADELAELRMDRRMRSRSRGRSSAGSSDRGDFYKWEIERLEREKRDMESREAMKKEETRFKTEMEIKRLKEEAKREAEEAEREADRKQIIADYERKTREAAEKQKAEEARILEKAERDRRLAAERQKEEERRILEKAEREKREAKEREEREWKEFERRRKEKEEKEKREAKEEQERVDDMTRKRLMEAGLQHWQIEAIMEKERAGKQQAQQPAPTKTTTTTTTRTLDTWRSHQPVYAKIHSDYLSIETLRYYDIPYKYDELDPSYIIVLREMDKHETNILFEHTRSLRAGRLLLEAPKEKRPEYAWYRKRERSKSRGRNDGEWKKFGILEYKR